jgi:mannose-6-phosphate isomerase-like protein (cupin superfamily)
MGRLAGCVCVVTGRRRRRRCAAASRLANEGAIVIGVDVVEHCVGEPHVHREDPAEDVYAAIHGTGTVTVIVDGEAVPLGAGRFIAVMPDLARHVRGGDGGLVLIAVCARPT